MTIENNSGGDIAAVENNGIQYESTTEEVIKSNDEVEKDLPSESEAQTSDEATESNDEGSQKKSGGFKRKIERLNADNALKDSEIQKLAAELAQFRGGNSPVDNQPNNQAKEQAAKNNAEPVETDFDNVLDFVKEHTKWTAKQAFSEFQTNQAEQVKINAEKAEFAKKETSYLERIVTVEEQHPTFREDAQKLYQAGLVTPTIEKAVLDSPIGEQITLHFINNPQDLQIIGKMNEPMVYRTIALLEAQLNTGKNQQQSKPQPATRQTNAAAPITPLGKQTGASQKDPSEMTQAEYEAWRYPRRN